MVVTINIWI